mgnify:CR=1 FL=1
MTDLYLRGSQGRYTFCRDATADEIVALAERILSRRFRKGEALGSPGDTARFLRGKLSTRQQEVFCCLFLDTRNRVIAFEELFYGTIDGATVHPREIVRRAMHHNAAGLIVAHNHPSGVAEPSRADRALTRRLREAVELVDVRMLDHFVIGEDVVSFAERGWL